MKTCIHCGKPLPDDASFCPYCETVQTEPKDAELPKKWRKKAVTILGIVLLIALTAAIGYGLRQPKTIEADGPELDYKGYHVMIRLNGLKDLEPPYEGEASAEKTNNANAGYAVPSRLFVFKDNDMVNAGEEFAALIDHASVTAAPRDGANAMETHDPVYDEVFPDAALASNVFYDTTCGTNDLTWTIVMKNGDTLVLNQAFTVHELVVVSYYPEDVPMQTIEELQALLGRIDAEIDPAAVVNLYLPPVVYEGGIHIADRTYTFYGSSDGTVNTTFTQPVTVNAEQPTYTDFFGVNFDGNGGTGIHAGRSVNCYDCEFSGWDTALLAGDGSWAAVHNCVFRDNGIGYQFNSGSSKLVSTNFDGTQFLRNGIGLHLLRVPGDKPLQMNGCVFEGHGTDLQNDCGISVDLSEADMR